MEEVEYTILNKKKALFEEKEKHEKLKKKYDEIFFKDLIGEILTKNESKEENKENQENSKNKEENEADNFAKIDKTKKPKKSKTKGKSKDKKDLNKQIGKNRPISTKPKEIDKIRKKENTKR